METLVNLLLDISLAHHYGLCAAGCIIGELSNRNLKSQFNVGAESPRVHVHLVNDIFFANEPCNVKFDIGKHQIFGA